MMYKRASIFCLSLTLNFSASAISLEDALTNAYINNQDLKSARVDFINNMEAFPQALSGFLPSITAEHDTVINNGKNITRVPGNPYKFSNKNISQTLNFNQPIFSGGSSVFSLKAAQEGFRALRSSYYAAEQKTLLSAINSYLDCISNKEKYNITETSVRSNQKQLESAKEKFSLGEGTRTDVASAKAGLAQAETDRLTAYANYQTSKANFIKIFGIEPEDLQTPDVPNGLPKTFDEYTQKSAVANLDVNSAKYDIKQKQAVVNIKKGALLPQVNFSVSNARNIYEPQGSSVNNRNIGSKVAITVPIFQTGTEYSKIRQAKNEVRKSVIQYDNAQKINNASCISTWEIFNATKSKIIATTEAVESAQIAYDGTFQEETVGSKTILDVLDAENKLFQAKISKVDAIKDNLLSAYQIKSQMGQLTAKSLRLKVKFFSPEDEFRRTKFKVIGF